MNKPLIRLQNYTMKHPHAHLSIKNLAIYEGDRIGLLGLNGSGKSTLLKFLSIGNSHFLPNVQGQLTGTAKAKYLSPSLPCDAELGAKLVVYEHLLKDGIKFSALPRATSAILKLAQLENKKSTSYKFLSSGEQARLRFFMAFHSNKQVFLIDELMSAGDFKFKNKSSNFLNNVFEATKSLVIVSHNLDEIKHNCNRVWLLKSGQLVDFETVKEGVELYEKSH